MISALRIRSNSPVEDAVQLGRRVRDLAVEGSTQIVQRADVPRLVEAGRENAAAAVNDAVGRITGRRRRRRQRSLISLAVVGVSLALVVGAWRLVRTKGLSALRSTGGDHVSASADQALDADALARATDDGMGIVGATTDTVFLTLEDSPFETADLEGTPDRMVAGPA